MASRYGDAETCLADMHILNYCPLVFMGETGRNITPDKLAAEEREPLLDACNTHLAKVVDTLKPTHVVGVGVWAEKRARDVLGPDTRILISRILHPSPASPLANADWPGQATAQLEAAGVWP
jgi:single-strand selective monofunctional uracil DNA glycosylase